MGDNLDIIFWAVLAALSFVGEILSVSFVLLFFSLGAVVALLTAFLGLGRRITMLRSEARMNPTI